ncbi:MAG: hypothetical protein V3V16_12335 [Melioribacteraceae bacterium]
MNIPNITYSDIKNETIFSKEFTAILFYNKSTAGSFLLELSLKDVFYDLSKLISVFKIVDLENEDLARDYKLYSEPSVLFFYKNVLEEIIYGPIPKIKLKEKLECLIKGCMREKFVKD